MSQHISIHLEKVYLLNVVLYADSLETIKKLVQVNSSIQEVLQMVRNTPNILRQSKKESDFCFNEWDALFLMKRTINEYLSRTARNLFPSINTLLLEGGEVPMYVDQLERISRIVLYDPPFDLTLMARIEDCIVEFIWNYNSVSIVNISKMKLLKRLKIDLNKQECNFKTIFKNQRQTIDVVRITNVLNYENLLVLKKYVGFEKIIVDAETDAPEIIIHKISQFAKVVADTFVPGKNDFLTLMDNNAIKISLKQKMSQNEMENFEKMIQNYLPANVEITGDYFDGIQNVLAKVKSATKMEIAIEIDPETKLEEILEKERNEREGAEEDREQRRMDRLNGIVRFDLENEETEEQKKARRKAHSKVVTTREKSIQLPTTLTSLVLNDKTSKLNSDNVKYIQEIELNNVDPKCYEINQLTTLTKLRVSNCTANFAHLSQLKDITFNSCFIEKVETIPMSVKSLKLYNCRNLKYETLDFLTQMTSLMIYDTRNVTNLDLNNLIHLQKCYFNHLIPISFPQNMTSLVIGSQNNKTIDLLQSTKLKEICIENTTDAVLVLPSVETLFLYDSVIAIKNKNDVLIKELHFEECENITFDFCNVCDVTRLSIFPFEDEYLELAKELPKLDLSNFN
ncbi:hypothetical protein EIN_400480 [Entamoeba invadens IP1]|uniref:Leucine-rich repeat containing protein n=1 Tax=Entamoeba invadens IP1 TaxID=370355 RepID=A0A0A1UA76_ENTIV|nr:hypothetical protein EIN_400480 [Entamoeba invadens IP1]ELP91948.1 hypothetical protein EIN_400480 [Entamoeba invadens IP1]|eukprot:XP_004258719.1 hypothetical protein EIN_400480 [Entamoeba invadens IP1]